MATKWYFWFENVRWVIEKKSLLQKKIILGGLIEEKKKHFLCVEKEGWLLNLKHQNDNANICKKCSLYFVKQSWDYQIILFVEHAKKF